MISFVPKVREGDALSNTSKTKQTARPITAKMSVPFVCPICRDPCEGIVRLECSHVFCGGCVGALKAASADPDSQVQHLLGSSDDLMVTEAAGNAAIETISCPICRSRVPVPAIPPGDGQAIERDREPSNESLQVIKKCTKHNGKPVTRFCQDCPKIPMLCDECVVSHAKAHKVNAIHGSSVDLNSLMKTILEQTDKRFEDIQALMDSTQETIDEVSDDADKACEGIRERAEKCIQRIRELEEEMVERVRAKQSEVCKTYELQLQDIETMESHMRLGKAMAEDSEQVPESDRCFLQLYSASLLKSTARLVTEYAEHSHQKITFASSPQVRLYPDGAQEGPYASLGEVSISKPTGNQVKTGSRVRGAKIDADVSKKSRLLMHVGGQGTKDGQFRRPIGIAVHPTTHQIFVSDFDAHRIQVFTPALDFVLKFGSMGSQNGMLNQPRGLAFNNRGDFLAVADSMNRRIQLFSTNGQFVSVVSRPGQLQRPTSIVFDAADRIYVADSLFKGIYLLTLDGSVVRSFTNAGAELTLSLSPKQELCFLSSTKDSLEVVHVPDDSQQGVFDLTDRSDKRKTQARVAIQPIQGASSVLCAPPDGLFLVADAEKKVVSVYDNNGRLLNTIEGAGQLDGAAVTPGAMAYDSGRLIVCDTKGYRVVVF